MDKTSGRILIVDDEPALLKMESVYLSRLGYTVETSDDTERAWDRFQQDASGFAIAVLDATMPGLSMNDLASRMLAANPGLRIIATSGYPADLRDVQTAAPGRVAFLQKPFSPEMLASEVRRMLASQEEGL